MRRKRIVSSIAALAMAASAFAGMAVTASAAEITESDVVFGVYDAENKTVSPQTEFTVDNGEGTTYTYIDTTYMEGSVLVGNQGGGRNYNFSEPVTSGVVKLAMNYTIPASSPSSGERYVWNIMGMNGAGEAITIASSVSGIGDLNWSDATLLRVTNSEGEVETVLGHNYQPRTRNCFILRDLTIDMGKKTLTYDFLTYSGGGSGQLNGNTTVVSGTINLPNDIASITGLNVPRNGNSFDMYMDNVMFYHIPADEDAAVSLTVNYMAGEDQIGSKVVDVSSYKIGDTVTYTFPAYVTDSNGKVYSYGSDTYSASTVLANAQDSVNVSYTAIDGSAQYMEFDGNTEIANVDKASNGAMTTGIQDGIDTIMVAEDGIYTVIFATGRRSDEATSNREGTWYVNDNTAEAKVLTFSGANPGEHSWESITLHQGDVIKVDGFNSKCAIDYVLIIKTGDIPVEPEPETDYVAANVSKSADESGLFIGDEGEEFPSAAVITGTVDATDLAENGKYTWVVNVNDNLFAKEFTATTTISGNSDVVFGLIVYNFEDVGLTDVNADDVQARLYLKGLDEITQPIE